MVQVSYPGVYIQEVPSGVHTVTSVATSIAAFFGRATKGPLNKAVRILSPADYERIFGPPHPNSDLAHSVRLFFANGGSDCYVVRLANGATKANVTLQTLNAQNVLIAEAKAEGIWANTVRLVVDYNTPTPHESFNLTIFQMQGGEVVATETFGNLSMNPSSQRFAPTLVKQGSQLIDLRIDQVAMGDPNVAASFYNQLGNSFAGFSQARRVLPNAAAALQGVFDGLVNPPPGPQTPRSQFEISVNDSPYVTVDLAPWVVPANINQIRDHICDRINAALSMLAPVESATCAWTTVSTGRCFTVTVASGAQASVRVRRAANNDIAGALMFGDDQGGLEYTRWSNFRPAPNGTLLRLGDPANPGTIATLNDVTDLVQNAITQLTIDADNIPLNAAPNNLVTTAAGDRWFVNAAGDNVETGDNDGVREKLRIIANAINSDPTLPWRAEVWGYHLAVLAKGGTINNRPGTINTGVANFDSGLIVNTRQYTLGVAGNTGPFANGVDGLEGSAPILTDYLGNVAAQTGFHALDPVDLFNLMVIPGDTEVDEATHTQLWGPASTYCEQQRAFLLIDSPASWTVNDRPEVVGNTNLIDTLRAPVVNKNAAVFYPRIKYNTGTVTETMGATGVIAGLMARIDASRGVWKTAAGLEADLRNIAGVNIKLTDRENGVLNKKGVNCLRVFPNGTVNWGGRTLDGDDDFGSEWKYYAVRRTALMIEESLFRGTKWVIFEGNDERLWAKIRLNLGAYMMSLFRQGAFQGTSPDKAFYVKCDKETTTQDDINKGIVNIEVGFAPLKPAEFVIIKIQQMTGDL